MGSPPPLVESSGAVVVGALDVGPGEGCDVSTPEEDVLGAVVIGADVEGAAVGNPVLDAVAPGETPLVVPGSGATEVVGEPVVTEAVGVGPGC